MNICEYQYALVKFSDSQCDEKKVWGKYREEGKNIFHYVSFSCSASELELECGEAGRAVQNLQQLPELKTIGAKVLLLRALRRSGKTEEAERLLIEFSGTAEEVKLLERLREEEEDWDLPKLSGRKAQKEEEEGNEEDDDEGEESEDEGESEEDEDESEEEEEEDEDESEDSDDDEENMEVDD